MHSSSHLSHDMPYHRVSHNISNYKSIIYFIFCYLCHRTPQAGLEIPLRKRAVVQTDGSVCTVGVFSDTVPPVSQARGRLRG